MVDKKITELNNITGVDLVDTDEFVVVDISADETKAVTRAEFFKNTPSIDVTGTVTADGLTVDGGGTVNGQLEIASTSPHFKLTDTDVTGFSRILGSNGNIYLDADPTNENANSQIYIRIDGKNTALFDDTGDISFYEDTGTTPKFFWDASAESLGIGTSSPSELLHLAADAPRIWVDASSAGEPTFNGDSLNGGVVLTAQGMNLTSKYTPALMFGSTDSELTTNTPRIGAAIVAEAAQTFSADTTGSMHLSFWTRDGTLTTAQNASERMRIDASGKVGIGTTNSSEALTVVGNGVFGDTTTKYNTVTINGGHVGDGDNDYGLTINAFEPAITFLDRSTGAGSGQMRIQSNGAFHLLADTTNDGTIGHSGNTTDFVMAKFEPTQHTFNVNSGATEAMRIDSSGNVGIGTTTGSYRLAVKDSGVDIALINQNDTVWTLGQNVIVDEFSIRDASAGQTRLHIDSSGNVGIATTNPATPLDVNGTVTATSYTETVFALTGTTPALDPANGNVQTWTLSGASSPTDGFSSGESMTLMIDDGAAYAITWPTMQWSGGSAPTLATTGYSVITLWKVGSTLYGASVGDMS